MATGMISQAVIFRDARQSALLRTGWVIQTMEMLI
jgi:hypothetical protein